MALFIKRDVLQAGDGRGVPAAGARRQRDVVVAGGATRAHGGARVALAHAARALQGRAQAALLLHAQEEVSQHTYLLILAVAVSHEACLYYFE